jgi:hypothetical protein
MAWMLASSGCFLPPSLEPETESDAAPNSIPVIIDSTFTSVDVAVRKEGQDPLTLTVRDLDVSDTVYVYFYVDYGRNEERGPPLGECRGAGGQHDRVLTCEINSLCYRIGLPDSGNHFLEAVVADRERLLVGEPTNRAFPEGTGISYRAWLMQCTE